MSISDRGTPSRAAFPKRFYKDAAVAATDGGFGVTLDGRPARTPARNALALPTEAAAQAVAGEWAAVETTIDPRAMPMTRLVNSVIDGVSRTHQAVFDEVLRYAGSDLLVYRAAEPPDLVRAQRDAWDPVMSWGREAFGANLVLGEGIVFVEQPPDVLDRLADRMKTLLGQGPASPFRLGALHVMTTLTGSALLGLAVAGGRIEPEQAWTAAHVDEDHQIAQWGEDAEATERRLRRWTDMRTAARLYRCV